MDVREEAEKYAVMPYTEVVTRDQTTDGRPCYVASHPELPGCMSQGETIAEALLNLDDARRMYIQSLLEDGLPVPLPRLAATTTDAREDIVSVEGAQQHATEYRGELRVLISA
jgi:predicted RNase H-like HicB family nuclease